MKILFLSQRFLLPMDTGGKIRTGNILEHLAKTHDITLLSNVESPKDDSYLPEMDRFCARFLSVPWKELPKYSKVFFARLLLQMFSPYPVSALNSSSKHLRQTLEREYATGEYDVVICDFVQSALEFRNILQVPTVLFQHNVESMIAKRHMDQAKNFLEKLFWWLQWKKMFAFEGRACRSFDTVIAVSPKDQEAFQTLYQLTNVATIPTGVDLEFFHPDPAVAVETANIVFCGSMDWLPNDDAVMFFLHEIFPHIQSRIPEARFTVVGRNPSPALQKLGDERSNLDVTGWVEDIRPYLARGTLVVVPIRIGGGTRMKIYEAMAMGKAVVSTSVGAEGLEFHDGENILIEDDAAAFAEKILALLENAQEREKIGKAASFFVRERFGWARIAEEFGRLCHSAVTRRNA